MATITPDALFETWFWPHYPNDVRAEPERFRDEDANPANNPALPAHLAHAAELFVANAPLLLGIAPTFDAAGVALLSRALTREKRDQLIAQGTPSDPANVLFNTVVHASAFVGEVIVRTAQGRWSIRRPLWESVVLRGSERSAGAIPPFHWILKHLGDTEIDRDTLTDRFQVHVAMATASIDALPVIVPSRSLPSIKSPTYDLLVKYLHQHLPTLTDVGRGFPSPIEFTSRAYASLGFSLLHGGRVLAMHGQCPPEGERPSVVEVLWLTANGFDHADAFPCDATPPYFARPLNDEMLEVTLAWKGRPHTHRLGFRGHR